MYTEIKKCRVCGNTELTPIIHLGEQTLTGVFPSSKEEKISGGPLELIKCQENKKNDGCGLVQLRHSYEHNEMYGENYGYRSGLNKSMVEHLRTRVQDILTHIEISVNDIILDIGSNDSTLLQQYPDVGASLIGIDPTGMKFKKYYPDYIRLIPEFFTAETFQNEFGNKKAKIVTSIAMFYDLESPLDFVEQVYEIIADDGIWVFEQSYMPEMLVKNAYDTICHEHLEYYRLKQIKWLMDKVGFKIIDVEFNDTNGGSFSVMVAKSSSLHQENSALVEKILKNENETQLNELLPYFEFKDRVFQHRDALQDFVADINNADSLMLGYGASTKGNVILQFCGFNEKDIPYIAEVNEDKFGSYTPGTYIPIISETEAKAMQPHSFLVLPWHFEENLVKREKEYINNGGKLIFPLPKIKTIG